MILIKTRKHHNNKGYRQIKRGKTVWQVEMIARKLNINGASGETLMVDDIKDTRTERTSPIN